MDSTSDLWIDMVVDGEIVPPVVTRTQTLPFDKLSWENFERLCYRLAWRIGDISDCHRYGIQGQGQKGIDLFFRDAAKGFYGTWQCKRHADFSATDIKDAVTKFLENSWATKSKFFGLAVTIDLTPTELTNEIITQADRCLQKGISFEPLDQNRLSQLLKAHPDLVDDFFGRPWANEFCGAEACKSLDERTLTKQQRLEARKDLSELYAVHFATMDAGLPAAAGSLGSADRSLPLQKRYIFPKAESVTTVTRKNVDALKREESAQQGAPRSNQSQVENADGAFLGFRTLEHRTKADLFEWLAGTEHSVVIGEPGLGKSAMLRFIAADLLLVKPRSEPLARKWGSFLPILIPFAVITRFVNRGEDGGILEYLTLWLREMNASARMLALFATALKDARILLLVDGLDEWSDPVTANTAMTKLRTFAESRRLPVVATSRPIGHQRISGFLPNWKRADLLHFDADQLRAFTLAWFEHFHSISQPLVEEGARVGASNRQADLFMDEIKQDSALFELATVPLLLSVLISLRLRSQVLPRSRYDALEAICKTLIQEQPQRRAQAALKNRGAFPLHSSMVEKGIYFLAHFVLASPTSTAVKRDDARSALAAFYSNEFRKSDADSYEFAAAQVDFAADEIGILVEPESEMIGFLHRSIQEYLAAKHLKSLSFADAKQFILENLTRSPWQETILALLALTDRRDEVDTITEEIRSSNFGPLYVHGVRLFLAKIAFRDFNCSTDVARTLAEETFSIIEKSNWAPIREALVREAIHGLGSEVLRGVVQKFVRRSFPRRIRWRSEIVKQLEIHPSEAVGRLLMDALYNSDSPHERREIANAVANCAEVCSQLADELCSILTSAAEADILGAALHALAKGWPTHVKLPEFLKQAQVSPASSVKCIAFIHLAMRGEREQAIKMQLSGYCNGRSRVYPWEDDVLDTLKECWPNNGELRDIALESVRHRFMPTPWHDHVALKYLVENFPQDDDVAEEIADILRKADRISTEFDHTVKWDSLIANFGGHRTVIPAAEESLAKHISEGWNDYGISKLARLAGTAKARELVFDRYRKDGMQVRWLVNTILALDRGWWDPELKTMLVDACRDEKKAAALADYLPQIFDPQSAKVQLLKLLEVADSFQIGFVFDGLAQVGAIELPEVIEAWKKRLAADKEESFWYFAKYPLLEHYRNTPEVRAAALSALHKPGYDTSALINAYGDDSEFRPLFEGLLQSASKSLRLAIVQELHPWGLRNDPFAIEILGEYVRESDPEVKTAAARRVYTSLKKFHPNLTPFVARLKVEMNMNGMDFDFHRQAAIAGLLILGHPEALSDDSLKREGGELPSFSIHAEGDTNWEFVRALVESWDSLVGACGPEIWKRFHSADVIVQELFRAGQRHSAMQLISDRLDEIRKQAAIDTDSFVALSLLEGHLPLFKDYSLMILNKFVREEGNTASMSWGYRDVEIQFEAARFLAKTYPGDPEIGKALVHVARFSVDQSASLSALCSGWPDEPYLAELWKGIKDQELNDAPQSAWLTTLFASPSKFAQYVANLPRLFQRDSFWRFPRESVRAVRARLTKDAKARQEVLSLLSSSADGDVIASTYRLLGLAAENNPTLCEWGGKKIEALRQSSIDRLQPMGYDMMTGQVRPIEFSILDACLTR